MSINSPLITAENEALNTRLESLRIEFLELYTLHKNMTEDDSTYLTSVYLEKLGYLQLELLEKQTEASGLRMKVSLIQASINRDEKPDLRAIDLEIKKRLQVFYSRIRQQSEDLEDAKKVLSSLVSEEDTRKLREIFRVLCKRLHPDLNPDQTDNEKDLFITVKAAYDLNKLGDLQRILLYLDGVGKEAPVPVSADERKERISYLEQQIVILKNKIEQLEQTFPFNIKNQIYDDEYVTGRKEELKKLIKTSEEEILKYTEILNIMADE